MRAGNRDCSAEAPQYMRQAKRSRIYEEAVTMQTCLQSCRILGNGCAARHTYISKYHMTRHRLLCRGATVYAASEAKPNIRRSRHDANGCAARHTYISKYHMTRHRLLCRGATVYAASEAKPNIRRSRHDANLFAIVQDSWKRVCCKAHLYLKIP